MDSDHLDKIEEFLDLLNKEEIHLRNALKANEGDIAELQTEWQERDSASENNLRSVEWNQYISLQKELGEIGDAKQRVSEGIYGICEVCEEPIGEARLRAIPTARMCIACREKNEKELGISQGNPSL